MGIFFFCFQFTFQEDKNLQVEDGHPTSLILFLFIEPIDFLHFSQLPLSHFRSAAAFGNNGE